MVAADQRRRLIAAVVTVVATRGYAHTTVVAVCRHAGVSERTLYQQFTGLPDLMVTTCQQGLDWVLGGVEQAVRTEPGCDGVRAGLRCLLERFGQEPELARCCLFEVCTAGAAGKQCRQRAVARLAAALWPSGDQAPSGADVGIRAELATGAVWHAIETRVFNGGASSLPALLPVLVEFLGLYDRAR